MRAKLIIDNLLPPIFFLEPPRGLLEHTAAGLKVRSSEDENSDEDLLSLIIMNYL